MSYEILIGEAGIEPSPEEIAEYEHEGYSDESFSLSVVVRPLSLSDAPDCSQFGNGQENSRSPGYGQWDNFCQTAGIWDLFFDKKTGLMRQQPGSQVLRQHHHEQVQIALAKWLRDHPGADRGEDGILDRLVWLDWWMDWTLENCRVPTIHNH